MKDAITYPVVVVGGLCKIAFMIDLCFDMLNYASKTKDNKVNKQITNKSIERFKKKSANGLTE